MQLLIIDKLGENLIYLPLFVCYSTNTIIKIIFSFNIPLSRKNHPLTTIKLCLNMHHIRCSVGQRHHKNIVFSLTKK